MAVDVDNPWVSFWQRVMTTAWLADVGVPMIATLVAIAIAVWAMKRQIRHDRTLADEQTWNNRVLAVAQHRAAVAHDLGRKISRALVRSYDAEPQWWTMHEWPGGGTIRTAAMEAEGVFSDGLDDEFWFVYQVVGGISRTWDACKSVKHDYTGEPSALTDALDSVLNPRIVELEQIVRCLSQWDGMGPVPLPQTLTQLPYRGDAGYQDWLTETQRNFVSYLKRYAQTRESRSRRNVDSQ
jgi:hypothetical protein